MLLDNGARDGVSDFVLLLPRIALGVVGSGFIAEVLPKALVAAWIGAGLRRHGLVIATLARRAHAGRAGGRLLHRAAALKGGAGTPQVIAYSIAWALFAIHRLLIWELPMMPARIVWLRAAVSLPLPFLAAAAMLLAKP